MNASFRINPGEKVGVVGPNGAGKTTVFGLISGDLLPDKGTVSKPTNVRLAYLKQQLPENAKNLSLLEYACSTMPELENIQEKIHVIEKGMASSPASQSALVQLGKLQCDFEALGGYTIRTRAKIILGGLGFPADRLDDDISSFSGGWQMRAGLAQVLLAEPNIMLLDEPSNYLDMPAIEWLQRFLSDFKGTIMLVSHDRYLLKKLTSTTIEIAGGMATRFSGNYDFYETERKNRFRSLEAAKNNQEKKKEQIERFVERFRAKNTKASQVRSRLKALDKMPEIRLPSQQNNAPIRLPEAPHSGAEIIRLENATAGYGSDAFMLENICLQVSRGQKIAISGYNGTGKTTLLRMMAGVLPLTGGKRVLGHKVVMGYQAQDFSDNMPPDQTLEDIIQNAAGPTNPGQRRDARSILGSFGFTGEENSKLCRNLSGGEKIRLAFARIFASPPNFLILDEPTTHLDIETREALQNELANYKGTVCMVSHDIEFVRNSADFIIAMEPPGIKLYYGDYDYFLEKSGFDSTARMTKKARPATSGQKELRKRRAQMRQAASKAKYQTEKDISQIEKKITTLEDEKSTITETIASDNQKVNFQSVNRRLAEIEREIARLSESWDKKTTLLQEMR
ncbi:MAG: ABC-F family ATP-binding cassette domain-containing protein [Victivallales bacterium]|nr:ABC-F family ATP-binding cassette domain-containing protein [Victivallales bacterium]